jgi:GAF domain-containing protein
MGTGHDVSGINFERLSEKVFSLLNSDYPHKLLITDIIVLIHIETGFESVGLRLHDGLDYPYYFTRGFTYDFIEKENYLCKLDRQGKPVRNEKGDPCLECMCGNVIGGRTDPSLPFFTNRGSFWTNCTTDLLAGTTEKDRQGKTRNRCNRAGYESVALLPIRYGTGAIYGLIQLNDRRKNMFTEEFISFMEGIAVSVALLFSIARQKEQLKNHTACLLN